MVFRESSFAKNQFRIPGKPPNSEGWYFRRELLLRHNIETKIKTLAARLVETCDRFILHGGRIPAPIHSMKN